MPPPAIPERSRCAGRERASAASARPPFDFSTDQLPVTPYWLRPVITAYVKGLTGPVARQTADVQYAVLDVWQWAWQQ